MKKFWILACVLATVSNAATRVSSKLVGGVETDPNNWKAAALITSSTNTCTGTVIGPRTVITASYCAANGGNVALKILGKNFTGKLQASGIQGFPIALIYTNEEITGVDMLSVGGTPAKDQDLTLFGFGCFEPGKTQPDGKLRVGPSKVTEVFATSFFGNLSPGGVLMCAGSLGAPGLLKVGSEYKVLGVLTSASFDADLTTVIGPNRLTRTDDKAQDFFKSFSSANGNTPICGVTQACSGGPQPATDLECALVPSPTSQKVGGQILLTLSVTKGTATQASIDGQSVSATGGSISVSKSVPNAYTSQAVVQNGQKSASCSASYTFTPADTPPPDVECVLTASPPTQTVGMPVQLTLTVTRGTPALASIDGVAVAVTGGSISVTKNVANRYTAQGLVQSGAKTASCPASYTYTGGDVPPPVAPNHALVPTYCGADANGSTSGISKVCLAELKKDAALTHKGFTQAILLTFNTGLTEMLPIIARKVSGTKDDLALYTGGVVAGTQTTTLDTRRATLQRAADGSPAQVEGRSKGGVNFRASLSSQRTR